MRILNYSVFLNEPGVKWVEEKGKKPPTIEQIKGWIRNRFKVSICSNSEVILNRNIVSLKEQDHSLTYLKFKDLSTEVNLKSISSYHASGQAKVTNAMILNPYQKGIISWKKAISLRCNNETLLVNRIRLMEEVPCIAERLDPRIEEEDLSDLMTMERLKTFLEYLDCNLLNVDNAFELFLISKILKLEDLKKKTRNFLLKNLTAEKIKELQKDTYSSGEIKNLQDRELHFLKRKFLKSYPELLYKKYIRKLNHPIEDLFQTIGSLKKIRTLKTVGVSCRKIENGEIKPYLAGSYLKDLIRVLKIMRAEIKTFELDMPDDQDIANLIAGVKENFKGLEELVVKHDFPVPLNLSSTALAEIFKAIVSLKKIKIVHCDLDNQGFESLIESIKSHSRLEQLEMSFKKATMQGVVSFLQGIIENPSLKEVRIESKNYQDHFDKEWVLNNLNRIESFNQLNIEGCNFKFEKRGPG